MLIDDDKLQEIYFQILQINVEPLCQAGETTINAVKGAAKFNEQGESNLHRLLLVTC